MSLDTWRRKLDRLAENDAAEGEPTLADFVLGAAELQEQERRAAILIDFARELAGTRPKPVVEQPPDATPSQPAPPAPAGQAYTVDAWNPAPIRAPAMDETQRRAALVRMHRRRLMGYQLTTAEGLALRNQYPELNYVEGYEPPPPAPPPPPMRNPWKLYAPSYATEETKAEVRRWGGVVEGDPEPE